MRIETGTFVQVRYFGIHFYGMIHGHFQKHNGKKWIDKEPTTYDIVRISEKGDRLELFYCAPKYVSVVAYLPEDFIQQWSLLVMKQGLDNIPSYLTK